jgi:ribosomal-protein-alanine N-acetyltransferase
MSTFTALAIECSGDRISTCVFDAEGRPRALHSRPSAHEHARHLLALVDLTLAEASVGARDLAGVAIDVGPGSFTALRVGLATARGLTQPFETPLVGVTSFAALLEGLSAPRRLAVPLIVAGRAQLYAGFYRGNAAGPPTILRGPASGDVGTIVAAVQEALTLCPRGFTPWFLGPGAARDRAALEAAFAGSTTAPDADGEVAGADGPRAEALAILGARLLAGRGEGAAPRPLYVRAPQAVEQAPAKRPIESELAFAPFTELDLEEVLEVESAVFSDPWPRQFFLEELRVAQSIACIARHRDKLAGYLLAWRLEGETHLGNLAVAPEYQRRGVGQALLSWLIEKMRAEGPGRITLEVRSSNFAAQELYRRFGFQAVALRRGYYQDSGEDALVMMRDLADA